MPIQGIRKIQTRKISKIRDLSQPARVRAPLVDGIPLRPRGGVEWGPEEDPLEKAAAQNVPGTLPERIVWKWLEDHDYTFEAQRAEYGGRLVVGGAVVDFLVYGFGRPIALRVQGTYWHGPEFPERQARDDEQFYRLISLGYGVADLWEHDIYQAVLDDRLTAYMEDALWSAL